MIDYLENVEFNIQKEAIQMNGNFPDLSWSYTDHQGHEHKWVKIDEQNYEVPSCVLMEVKEYDQQTQERHTTYNYYCSQCMERIKPPKTYQSRWIPTIKKITGQGKVSNPIDIGDRIDLSFIDCIKKGKAVITGASMQSGSLSTEDHFIINFESVGELEMEDN